MMTLDKKYRDDLVAALRAHDISGERVGEVLAEIEGHVAETGEDPAEAFGGPREYAAQVVAQLDRRTGKRSTLEMVASTLAVLALTMIGSEYLLDGLFADAATVPYTVKDTVALLALLVLLGTGTFLFVRAAGGSKAYGGAAVGVLALAILSQPVIGWIFDDVAPLYEMPSGFAIVLGAVFLLGAVGLLLRAFRRGRVVYPKVS